MRRLFAFTSSAVVLALSLPMPLRAQPSALTDLSGEQYTAVSGVSADGRVLFGNTVVPEAQPTVINRPLVWRQVDGTWVRTILPANDSEGTQPYAISGDGSVIAGSVSGFVADEKPLVWTYGDGAWQRFELPLPPDHGAQPRWISEDGSVVIGIVASEADGPLVQNIAWAWRRVGGVWSGVRLPDGEVPPDARDVVYDKALSGDGSAFAGIQLRDVVNEDETETRVMLPVVWRHNGDSWQVFTLRSPAGDELNGKVRMLSADGRIAVGEMKLGETEQSWHGVVWSYSDETNSWSAALLPSLGAGNTNPYSISSDGTRVVGESRRKVIASPVATLWTRTGGSWSASPLGTTTTGFSRGMIISGDGRLAFRDQPAGRTLYHLASRRNLPIAVIVATLEQRSAGSETWNFSASGGNPEITALGHDAEANAYTLIGSVLVGGTRRPFVISGYAPFLFGETTHVGDTVTDAEVPDLGAGAYKVTGLPPGLSYDDATRTVTGRFSRVGLYTTTILNTVNKRKRTVLTLVEPLPETSVGAFQALLQAGDEGTETYPVARLTVAANVSGAFTGTLESDDGATYRLKGVLAPDAENPGELAAFATYGAAEAGLTIARKKGNVPATFKLRVNLRADGSVRATLEKTGAGLYASSFEDGSPQTRYAGKLPENSAPWRGRYTATLGVASALFEDARPLPAGAGFATITVAANGKLSATGRLADGQKFSGSVLPGADESYRLFFLPYGRRDSVFAGWLRFEERGGGPYHVPAEAGTDLYWMRAAAPGSKLYPEGFGPAGLALRAEPWVKPGGASGFGVSAGAALPLTLAGARFSNAQGMNDYDLPRSAQFLATGVRLAPEAESGGAMSFSINRDTGAVSGGFTLVEPVGGAKRRVSFAGVLLQAAAGDTATPLLEGYFLEAALTNAESPLTLSGLITLTKPVD